MTVAVLLAALVALGRLPRLSRRHRAPDVDGDVAARLVLLSVRAGDSVHGALATAADEADPTTASAIRRAAHLARVSGFPAAVDDADPALQSLLAVLARATAVGAPIGAELAAHVREADRERHMGEVARARSLPVRLAIPLTVLILPGIVLMTVGPSLVGAITGLVDPTVLLP